MLASAYAPVYQWSATPTDAPVFALSRTIDEPRERVFTAWTDPVQLPRWWGPYRLTVTDCELDVRPGGAYRIVMGDHQGIEYPLRGTITTASKPQCLQVSVNIARYPALWPDRARSIGENRTIHADTVQWDVQFHGCHGGTRVEVITRCMSVADRDGLLALGMDEQWRESLEKLEDHLAKQTCQRALTENR